MGAGGGLNAAPPGDWEELAAAVQAIGPAVGAETIRRSAELLAPLHETADDDSGIVVELDQPYGEHPEQALDLFLPAGPAPRGVVLFVHGGAFVGGARRRTGTPYHSNIGRWAARRGWAGVLAGHRLAPAAQWPSAAHDVALAVEWCRSRLRAADGGPLPLHLLGNSSGAVHAAAYAVGGPGHAAAEPAPASLALISGIYDLPAFGEERLRPYFGSRPELIEEWRLLELLAGSEIPLLFAAGEYDTPDSHEQFLAALGACTRTRGTLPACARARAANHFTIVHAIGTRFDDLGPALERFFSAAEATRRAHACSARSPVS
ncbi:alpha/beta hydrolase [Leucobacter massiliensis]|nr:alpha/beta hydrolase [Leucobacter massiliensis]